MPSPTDDLRDLLLRLLRSGASNPVLDQLLDDYVRYHLVVVLLGGAFVLGLLAAAWRARRWWRLTWLVLSACTAVLVIANLSNVLHPRRGFAGVVDGLGTPVAGSRLAELRPALADWLRRGTTARPAVVRAAIDHRLGWQRPKAVISALALVVVAAIGVRAPRRSIAVASVGVCVVLAATVIGNAQGSVAPLTLTLMFG